MAENQNAPAVIHTGNELAAFGSSAGFEHAQRMAKALAASTVVPKDYQQNVSNCIVALEMANRIGVSPIMVMQNMNVIHGRPSWSSTFIISAINTCGRFSQPLNYKLSGEGLKRVCIAYTFDKQGNLVEGTPVSIEMAQKEGWYGKSGSKWQTMPEQMLRYRAASFFGRLHCPEIMLGMQSVDEVADAFGAEKSAEKSAVNESILCRNINIEAETVQEPAAAESVEDEEEPMD